MVFLFAFACNLGVVEFVGDFIFLVMLFFHQYHHVLINELNLNAEKNLYITTSEIYIKLRKRYIKRDRGILLSICWPRCTNAQNLLKFDRRSHIERGAHDRRDAISKNQKQHPRARSITSSTSDSHKHRITRRVKHHKGLVYSFSSRSPSLSPCGLVILLKRAGNASHQRNHYSGICVAGLEIFLQSCQHIVSVRGLHRGVRHPSDYTDYTVEP